jgi:hypothetical protein
MTIVESFIVHAIEDAGQDFKHFGLISLEGQRNDE